MNAMTETRGDGLILSALRVPPHNLQAEQALLGAIMANNRAYEQVSEFLRPEHFANGVHQRIFEVMQRRIDAGQAADAITLRGELEGTGILEPEGGVAYLARLLTAMVAIINAGDYGLAIADAWIRRQLIHLGETMVNRAYGAEPDLQTPGQIEDIEAQLSLLAEGGSTTPPLVTAGQAGQDVLEGMVAARAHKGGLLGVDTGLRGANRMLKGFRKAQFILVGARPAMGKTAFGLTISVNAAKTGARVLFVSAEMKASSVMARAGAADSGVPLTVVESGHVEVGDELVPAPQRDIDAVFVAQRELKDLPLVFDDRSAPTVPYIRGRARRMKRKGGLDLIVIDYLGLLRGSEAAARQNRNAEVSEISRDLKAMAKELDVPVVALSQLSRKNEDRDGKRPTMADLRDSGSLEQDGDVVMFLHREHYYLALHPPSKKDRESQAEFEAREEEWASAVARSYGKAELILSKQRQGPVGPIRLQWDAERTWFYDDNQHPAE
jgi:replicative DNA helicase